MSKNEELACSVPKTFYFMFQLAKLHGIAPISAEKTTNGYRITVSHVSIAISYVVITIFNILSVLALIRDMNIDPEKSARYHAGIRSLVWITELFGCMGIAGIAVYGGPERTREDIRNISKIHKINRELRKFATKDHTKEVGENARLIKWGLLILTYTISCIIDNSYFMYFCFKHDRDVATMCLYIPYMLYNNIKHCLLFQLSFTTFEICHSLVTFNDILEEISSAKQDFNISTVLPGLSPMKDKLINKAIKIKVKPMEFIKSTTKPPQQPHETIRYLASIHNSICDVIRRTNDNYAFGHLMLVLIILLGLVMTPYNLIVNITGEKVNIALLALQILWTILLAASMIILIEPCHKTQDEIDRTNLLVGKLSIRCTDQLVCEELEKFSRYLALNKVAYTPYGIYAISRCLIASVASSVCTYLVIILQFQVPDNGEYY